MKLDALSPVILFLTLHSNFKSWHFIIQSIYFNILFLVAHPFSVALCSSFDILVLCSANLLFEQYIPLLVRYCLLLLIDSFNQGFNMTVHPCPDACFNYIGAGVLVAGLFPISRRSPIKFRLRMCLRCCFWVASKSVRLSVSGLLLETGVIVEGEGWELVDTSSSLLLFWFMEASILMVVW
jgi:hypothetical protein